MYFAVRNLSVRYEKVQALDNVSLELEHGEIVALIGANGAGKTTTLRAITGLKQAAEGEIWFEDQRIDQLSPTEICARGVAMVPEGRHVSSEIRVITVLGNDPQGALLSSSGDPQWGMRPL